MNNLQTLENDAKRMVSLAKKAGADACDAVLMSGNSLSVSVREGSVEETKRAERDRVSLRVFCGKKVASITANSLENPEMLAERAVAMAKVSPEDPFQGLADRSNLYDTQALSSDLQALELMDNTELSADTLEKAALEAEQAGLSVDGVSKSMGSGMGSSHSGFVLVTSDDFIGSYERSGFSISASFVAGEGTGMERDYDFDSAIHLSDLQQAEVIGKKAAENVVKRVGGRQVPSGAFPVICDPRISNSMLGAMMGSINASSIARKTSFLQDQMGKQIAASGITVVDDPKMKRRGSSMPFDGEGVASERFEFVKDGILQDWVLDSATARELSLKTNGRGSRGETGISPSTTNCYMQPGTQTPEEMIGEIKEGLYLIETMGHGTNMVTGDFSKGAAGFWVKDGEIAFPVSEITVAGNLKDMFLNMRPANDLIFKYGTNAPTLLIEGMTIGGS